ncbi:Cloroperoxidase [Obba rivulosa]|uniref:Cloroperoxidase n=1 Tax=Obba rivulosa TaxID=1052685 RepID=A0A8E2DPC5_9APHY|nr:Cloroperoxidase [Obba rivulosa]
MAPTALRKMATYAITLGVLATILRAFMSLDDMTRPIDARTSRAQHPFVAPERTDSRSPCPALNTLANHGYLPHDGRFISQTDLIRAMRQGYNISLPLAAFLTWGSFSLLMQFKDLSLGDLARHNCIEHNSSLVHADTYANREYAPTRPVAEYMARLLEFSSDGHVMTFHDFIKARARRDAESAVPLAPVHAEITRGEISMVVGIFGRQNETVPLSWLQQWWMEERFPNDFLPDHEQTLLRTVLTSRRVKSQVAQLGHQPKPKSPSIWSMS